MDSDSKKIIGQNFRRFRTEKGFSQETVSEGICSPQNVSHLEHGRNIPRVEVMKQLAERLRVPLREIMGMQEDQLKVDEQITLARVYMELRDYDHALHVIEGLLTNEELLEFQKNELLVHQAESLIRSGKRREGIDVLRSFLEQQEVRQSIEDEKLCIAYNILGNGYFAVREFEKAFASYEQGYKITLRLPFFGIASARVTNNLGLACNQLNMKHDAKFYLEKARKFYQSIADVRSLADTLFELALASNDPNYAIKSQILYESLNLVREAHIVKQHYAFHVESKQDYQKALQDLQTVAGELANINDCGSALFTLSRAVMICLEHSDMEQAHYYLTLANAQAEQLQHKDTFMLAYYHRALAKFSLRSGNYTECLHHSQLSAEMYARMEMYAESADSLKISSEAYKQQGMLDTAYDVFEKAYELLSQSRRRNSE